MFDSGVNVSFWVIRLSKAWFLAVGKAEEEKRGGGRIKWSLVVRVNEDFCSDGSNKSQACSHTGVLPHAVLASCCFFPAPLYFTMHFLEIWALKFKPPAKVQVDYGWWWCEKDRGRRKDKRGMCECLSLSCWLCVVYVSSRLSSLLSCQLIDLIAHKDVATFYNAGTKWHSTEKMKFKEDCWRQTWHLLFCVSVLLWDSRNEVVDGTNVEANVDLILSRNWHAEGKMIFLFVLETPVVCFRSLEIWL